MAQHGRDRHKSEADKGHSAAKTSASERSGSHARRAVDERATPTRKRPTVDASRHRQPPVPKGQPVALKEPRPTTRVKQTATPGLFSTTKRKWIGALVALVLVVGTGNAIGGTSSPSEPAGQSLAVTGLSSQASSSKSAEAEAARAAETKAKEEADRKAKEEAEAQAAAEAEAQAQAQREAEAQAQRDAEAQRAAAAQSAPAASPQSRAAEPQSTPAPQASTQNGATVYIAASGKGGSYHKRSTCGRMKDSSPLSLSEAQARGYAPCGNCY